MHYTPSTYASFQMAHCLCHKWQCVSATRNKSTHHIKSQRTTTHSITTYVTSRKQFYQLTATTKMAAVGSGCSEPPLSLDPNWITCAHKMREQCYSCIHLRRKSKKGPILVLLDWPFLEIFLSRLWSQKLASLYIFCNFIPQKSFVI